MLAAGRYEDYGVRFIGVVYQDRPASARAMLDELGWGYQYVTDSNSRAAIVFGVSGVPETYFVGRDGVIRARISGEINIAALSAMLDGMLFRGGCS
ncbi:MAG: redoxin domain-containing protein [Acidobacteria bacterium]|nr:redoxin domain-containing protein [Acidobacteriota bacterium]